MPTVYGLLPVLAIKKRSKRTQCTFCVRVVDLHIDSYGEYMVMDSSSMDPMVDLMLSGDWGPPPPARTRIGEQNGGSLRGLVEVY